MTTLNDYFTYTIAAHWLAPIFNADFTFEHNEYPSEGACVIT
jgi:hypothetical protein